MGSNNSNNSNISITSIISNSPDNPMNYIWIDKNVYDFENVKIYNELLSINGNLDLQRYQTVTEAFNYIIVKLDNNDPKYNFGNITIIISGTLYFEFYYSFNKIIDKVRFFPTVVVFLDQKELFIQKLKNNGLYEKNCLLDHNLIFNSDEKFKRYIIEGKKEEEKQLSFELMIIIKN